MDFVIRGEIKLRVSKANFIYIFCVFGALRLLYMDTFWEVWENRRELFFEDRTRVWKVFFNLADGVGEQLALGVGEQVIK